MPLVLKDSWSKYFEMPLLVKNLLEHVWPPKGNNYHACSTDILPNVVLKADRRIHYIQFIVFIIFILVHYIKH